MEMNATPGTGGLVDTPRRLVESSYTEGPGTKALGSRSGTRFCA